MQLKIRCKMKEKKIIAVTGKQGSGKSSFCNALAKELNANVFNLDIYSTSIIFYILYRNYTSFTIVLSIILLKKSAIFALYFITKLTNFLGTIISLIISCPSR